jgi:hypothetical protein
LIVSICIFVTGAAKAQINLSSEDILALSTSLEKNNAPAHSVAEADPSPSLLGGVELNNGRPNLDALLKEEISITLGRMSVSGKYTTSPKLFRRLTGQQFAGRKV